MTDRLQARVQAAFAQAWGGAPTRVVRAPGRVNLIGEHTDYNDGFVLPCAIDFQTVVAARPRDDGQLRVVAADCGDERDAFATALPVARHAQHEWANYVRGVVVALQQRGWPVQGADLAVAGDVPQGAGLSSSAALEVAVVQALKSLQGLDALSPTEMALVAQQAENDFVGCRCGVMDQLISARGEAGHALLIDCRSLQARPVPLPPDLAVVIVHSRVRRGLVDSEYNTRRAQCEAAARQHGVAALRDLDLARLQAHEAALDPVVFRRARHVITENQRTLEAAEALAQGDLPRLGRLMAASHASMRDDFEITTPAIDRLVEIAQAAIGPQGGVRMTGGGFGGCIVALMPQSRVEAVRTAIAANYRSPEGEPASVFVCKAAQGAGEA